MGKPTARDASASADERARGDGLYVVDEGDESDGAPVLLIHGLSLDRRMWAPQVEPLLNSGHRVVRYDVRGFGRSPAPTAGHVFDADDVPRLLDLLDVDRAHVVGLSLGGAIAADLGIHHGDRVRSLVFADAAVGGMPFTGPYRGINAHVVKLARSESVSAAKDAWLGCDLFAPARRNHDVAQALAEIVKDYSGEHWIRDGRYLHADSWNRLSEIAAPSMVIVGALDLADFRHAADVLATRIPGADKVELLDCGHMSNLEQPAAFNRALLSFIGAH